MTTMEKPEMEKERLLREIQNFSLDEEGGDARFARKLARENGWSQKRAERVVKEYKRFLCLAATSGVEVSPSEEVDQAWHLHLTYTRSYWENLCGKILGKPLHHNPSKGGKSEDEKYRAMYERTKTLYAQTFGEAPPADIWPDAETRFKQARSARRIDGSRFWVIPKPKWNAKAVASATLLAGVAAGLAAAEKFWESASVVAFSIAGLFDFLKPKPKDPAQKKDPEESAASNGVDFGYESGDNGGDSDTKSEGGFWSSFFSGDSSADSGGDSGGGGASGDGCSSGCGGGCGGGGD